MNAIPAASDPVISVDAMGGDRGPATVVAGLDRCARETRDLRFLLHGPEEVLTPLVARRASLAGRCEVRHAAKAVAMSDKPSVALRRAQGTSMWSALTAITAGEAQAAVSCGNTGALMAMATMRLRRAEGVDRPAIAVFWPSRTGSGHTIVLDVGADVRADPQALAQFAAMGAEYARVALDLDRPRVGLLNVGSEEGKGRPELQEASRLIGENAEHCGYDWRGYVEGGDLCGDKADVIVTDGFTGNVALKSAEGAAAFIGDEMKRAFRHTWLSRLAALMAMPSLSRMKRRIDPRRVNGGVFLGLRGAVVKSHGSADATGVAAAVWLAARMARTGFTERVAGKAAFLTMQRQALGGAAAQ